MAAPSLLITRYQLLIPSEAKSVVPGRLELPTSTLSVWRSNQLSYRTIVPGWLTVQDFWACIFEPGFLFLLYVKQVL